MDVNPVGMIIPNDDTVDFVNGSVFLMSKLLIGILFVEFV